MASSSRNLTLTEELERLEQSITLTLQEIDHNFSKAHRIVTTSILPLVEQYGEHSNKVWESSKFWKQFFEASANVSLSGYEELAGEGETTAAEETVDDSTSELHTAQVDVTAESSEFQDHQQPMIDDDTSILDVTISGSTPRLNVNKAMQAQFADFGSPYQALRRELKGDKGVFKDDLIADKDSDDFSDEDDGPALLPRSSRLPDMSMTPRTTALFEDASPERKSKDPLLHRVLDKTYRVQATPMKSIVSTEQFRGRPTAAKIAEEADEDRTRRALWADSPTSSPEMAVPKLRSDLYNMPSEKMPRRHVSNTMTAAPTPGVSVQTPATSKRRDIFAEVRSTKDAKGKGKNVDELQWDSDDDIENDSFFGGMSPPKTIQFVLPPSKLLQTPAREASRRIVDDILITAGEAPELEDEYSPSLVKVNHDILDDSF